MIDIVSAHDELDIGLFDTQTTRAGNILAVQVGSLEYAKDLGIDLKYFLSEDFRFQNSSFKAYLIETLANKSINVASVVELVENLSRKYTFNIQAEQISTGLIAR
jgi:hypothetical protein